MHVFSDSVYDCLHIFHKDGQTDRQTYIHTYIIYVHTSYTVHTYTQTESWDSSYFLFVIFYDSFGESSFYAYSSISA